jgi:hypothetical protein
VVAFGTVAVFIVVAHVAVAPVAVVSAIAAEQ